MNDEVIEMGLPCQCPHCGAGILVKINQPYPLIDILTPDELPEEIQGAIVNQNDNTQEPEAA